MSWEAEHKRFDEHFHKEIIDEPCLNLPIIEQKFGIDVQYDMLDSLIYDALLEEDFPPLPIIDQKIVQWIDGLEELEENQLKAVPDAHVQQEPGHKAQLQLTQCDTCGKEFQFPVNVRRHKWKHRHKSEEEIMESTKIQFKEYWEKLGVYKACKIISTRGAKLPANLGELQFQGIIGAVSSYVEALDDENQCLEHNLVIAFLLRPERATECPPFQVMLEALHLLSDGNVFRGTLNPEIQQIVFPESISMSKIVEQGLLASFEFLVECCMMEAWADDRKRIANLLIEEEAEAARQEMQATAASASKAKKSKPSSSQRKKEKARKQEKSNLMEQLTDAKKNDTLKDEEHHDSSSQPNQMDSKEEVYMAEKSSRYHPEEDSSNVAATQSNLVPSIDNFVAATTLASESIEGMNPGHLIDDDSKDLGPLEGQSTALNSKASKASSAQRRKGWPKKSKLSKKYTEDNFSKDKKEHDSSMQLKQRDFEQSKDDPTEQSPELKKENAISNAAEAQSNLMQSIADFVQDVTSSWVNQEKPIEIMEEGMKAADSIVDDISGLVPPNTRPALDIGGPLSEMCSQDEYREGQGEWGGTTIAGDALEDQEEHDASSQLNQKDYEESEVNLVDKSSENPREQDSFDVDTTLPKGMAILGTSVQDRLHPSKSSEDNAEILIRLEGAGWTNHEINTFLKPAALDSGHSVEEGNFTRSQRIQYEYGGVSILRRPSEAPADVDPLAARRDTLSSKNKKPADREDFTTALVSVPRESAESNATVQNVPEEHEDSKAPGELEGITTVAMMSGQSDIESNARALLQFLKQRWDDAIADPDSEYAA